MSNFDKYMPPILGAVFVAMMFAFVILAVSISSCAIGLSNDEIISETKKCEEAGFDAITVHDAYERPRRVECVQREGR